MTTLCRYSRSEVYEVLILPECPLGLSAAEHKHCLCRKRVYGFGPHELRVLSCCYPKTWQGSEIRRPLPFAAMIKDNYKKGRKETMPEEPKPDPKPVTTALAPAAGTNLDFYQRIADPIDAVDKLGLAFSQSRMFGCKNDSQGRVLAMACLTERRSPVDLMREYHLIEGNLTMKADVMLARFNAVGGDHTIVERSPERAAILLKLKRKSQEFEFTWEEARLEPYVYCKDGRTLKDNWSTPRRRMQMLWARLVSDSVRAFAPQCVAGQYTPEDFGRHEDDVLTVEATVVEEEAGILVFKKDEPAAKEKPEPEPPPILLLLPEQPALAKVSREQLLEMKKFKDQLGYGSDIWKQILERFGVTTAKDLDPNEAERLLLWLQKQAGKASSKNELEQWASGEIPF